LFRPDDPFEPRDEVFEEVWQAQTLALADTLVRAGCFSATDWAETLGAALRDAEIRGQPDTAQTYYACALAALEILSANYAGISQGEQERRTAAWRRAYLNTPHGKPVALSAGEQP